MTIERFVLVRFSSAEVLICTGIKSWEKQSHGITKSYSKNYKLSHELKFEANVTDTFYVKFCKITEE